MLERSTRLDGALSSQRNGMFRVDSTRPGRSGSPGGAGTRKPGIVHEAWPGQQVHIACSEKARPLYSHYTVTYLTQGVYWRHMPPVASMVMHRDEPLARRWPPIR